MDEQLLIKGKAKDLGGFIVYRSLPNAKKRSVGPFVFIDHMGPALVQNPSEMDVRPHPHIGLATITYLFEGQSFHRDSIGSAQAVLPGDLNWMTSGSGIVHSERAPQELKISGEAQKYHGVQIWVALPVEHEHTAPVFFHYPKEVLPIFKLNSHLEAKLLVGELNDKKSPVKTYSPTTLAMLSAQETGHYNLATSCDEAGILLVSGQATVDNQELEVNDVLVVANPKQISITYSSDCILMLFGGQKLPEPRYMWWNFVSSNKEAVKAAADLWQKQQMGHIHGETEFIPLPAEVLI